MRRLLLLSIAVVCLGTVPRFCYSNEPTEYRWVYVQTNLQVAENAERLEQVLRRARAAGYNGLLLADYKLNVLDRVTDRYLVHAKRIRELCAELELELVPSIGSFGYSAGILAHDPNLAEGLPVRDMPLVVRDGRAVLSDGPQNLVPGDFEERRGNRFNEIRVANWSAADQRAGVSAGRLLADSFRRSIEIVRRQSPKARLCVWSDMFDPHHNARDNYYLVRGDLAGSWEGVPPEVTIINWNHGHARQSLPFFGQRGNTQILAGYYDQDSGSIRDWQAQAQASDRVSGVMYTTWQNKYDDLEAFAHAAWGKRRPNPGNEKP